METGEQLTSGHATSKAKKFLFRKKEKKLLIQQFLETLESFTFHLFVLYGNTNNSVHWRKNLKKGDILSVLDFAEYFTAKVQDDCLCTHLAKQQITIHVVNYYINEDNHIVTCEP